MAKAFSIASWNVEHFRGDPARTDRWIDDYSDHCLLFMEVQRI
jgi:hypothetical protein